MGYFDGITEGFFKTGATGQRIYYPFGVFGRGRVLSNDGEEKKVKTILKWSIIAGAFLLFISMRSGISFEIKAASISAIMATQCAACYLPVRSHPIAGERMKLAESYRNSARGAGRGTLWVLFCLGVLMTSAGVFIAFAYKGSLLDKLALIGAAAFFGVCTLILAWMIHQAGRQD